MKRCFLFLAILLWVGCTKPNPRSCADGSCTDPAFPFCDVDGTLGGTIGECIAVTCESASFETCRGDQALVCNSTGNNFDLVDCPLGCEPSTGCRTCETDAQCGNPAPICDQGLFSCRGCTEDDECPSRVCEDGSCAAAAGIVYAANDGSSSSDCSIDAPCSVSRALQLAKAALPQPTIRILPGVYLVGLSFSGNTTSPINIVATGATIGDQTALNATNGARVAIRGGEFVGSQFALSCGMTTTTDSEFAVRDAKLVAGDESATVIQGGADCRISMRGSKLFVNDGTAMVLVNGGSFSGDGLHITGSNPAIQLLFTDVHLTILNSILEDPSFLFSTTDSSTTSSAYLGSNTILLRSQFNQIDCETLDEELTVRLENNIVVAMGTQDPSVIRGSLCSLTNNILHPQQTVAPNNTDVDPLFVDAASGDYHVQPTSPAINAANPQPLVLNDHDFIGAPRPQGAGPDIGAFEQ